MVVVTAFTGTPALVRLALRRDRMQLPAWLLTITLVAAATAGSVTGLYTTDQELLLGTEYRATSAVTRAFGGPIAGASTGAIAMIEMYATVAVLAALMSTFAVVRHTRQHEESGRVELVGSTVAGRHATLGAALLVTTGANVVLAGLTAVVLIAQGLEPVGSLAAGAAVGAAGVVFAGVAAVTAQIFSTTRAANGAAGAAVGLAFVLRAVGDAAGTITAGNTVVRAAWPSWLSPIGWGQQLRPFHQERWGLLLLFAGLLAVLAGVAIVLGSRRDVGSGLVPARPGPPAASAALGSSFGLAWRLQRGIVAGWAVAMVVLGATFGALGDEVGQMVGSSQQLGEALGAAVPGADLLDAYIVVMMGLLGTGAGAFAVQTLLRMRAEEADGPLESVLATAVGRGRWLAGHLACVLLGMAGILLLGGLSAGITYGLVADDLTGRLGAILLATMVQLPASLALAAFVVAVFGWLPRWVAGLGWAALVFCLLLGQIGALLELPQAVLNVSPYSHVPAVPAIELSATPLVLLSAVAVLLTAAGLIRLRARDVLT